MILFTDLDGTLLTDSKELTKENQDAIRDAIEAGHKVVISTGRPLAGATAQAHALHLDGKGCGAGKDAFKPKEEKTASQEVLEKPHVDKELSPMEMSIICSNLARGCEKQYLPQQADDFRKLAEFFRSKAAPVEEASTAKLLDLIEQDLSVGYPYGNAVESSGLIQNT